MVLILNHSVSRLVQNEAVSYQILHFKCQILSQKLQCVRQMNIPAQFISYLQMLQMKPCDNYLWILWGKTHGDMGILQLDSQPAETCVYK